MAAPTGTDFNISSIEGINFSTTYTTYDQTAAVSSTNSPDNPGLPFALGTHAFGTDGTEYLFVKASAAVVQYAAVSIDKDSNVTTLTLALLRALTDYGFAQVAIASGAYGWVALRGKSIGVLARLSSLPNVPLYISNVSPGRVSSTSVRSTSGGTLLNVVLTTCGTATPSGAVVANASWPGTSRAGG
jgi:hypothetical protein